MRQQMKAKIVLEDGSVFIGQSFGYPKDMMGEFVFNTSMTGYQEILTDPSYKNQIVTMTYPLIGNYGVNEEDLESDQIYVSGMIVREYSKHYSNWRATSSLADFLIKHEIPGIEEIDTRKLTRNIRIHGALRGIIHFGEKSQEELLNIVQSSPVMGGQNLAEVVSCQSPREYELPAEGRQKYKVVAFDYGIKTNILRKLRERGCLVKVLPCYTSVEEVLGENPDGIFLSNGPGDPEAVKQAIEITKALIGKKPMFGICLGHQIISLALGLPTYKLKFGHRGGNQPVMDLTTGKVEITAQNHGFCVDSTQLPADIEVTHINLNDQTVEGIRHTSLPLFSVQYHPEASPGPHDSDYLFDRFVLLMDEYKSARTKTP